MSDTFAQIDPKPLPQVAPGGQASKAGRSSGNSPADGPTDEFETLLSQETAPGTKGDLAQSITEVDQTATTETDASIAQGPPNDENALALATALAGIIPGQPVPVKSEPAGKSGVRVEAPTLPPPPGGGPPANANLENAASSGEKSPSENPGRPGPAAAPGAGQTASEAGATTTGASAALNGQGAPGQATGAAPSVPAVPAVFAAQAPPANAAIASNAPATIDTAQTQAASVAGQANVVADDAKPTRTAPSRTSESRKEATATSTKAQNAQNAQNTRNSGLTTAQAALAIERVLGEGPVSAISTGDTGSVTPGGTPLNQNPSTVLRVASPLTPGAPPNLPIRSIALSMVQQSIQGIRQFTINLSPASLGRIQVDLEIGKDGRVNANLTVDRPDTLDALQRDARALERALQNAGLKPDQGSLNFSLRDQSGGRETTGRDASDRDRPIRDIQPLPEQVPQRSISLSALDISV